MLKKLYEESSLYLEIDDEEMKKRIDFLVLELGRTHGISLEQKARLANEVFHAVRKLDVLQELLEMPEVTEIMVNGIEGIYIERYGIIEKWRKNFASQKKLEDVIQTMVSKYNRRVNEAMPIMDTRLEDGSRVNIVLSPIAINGPIVTIRKFPKEKITMRQLVEWGALTLEAAEFLKKAVALKYNIFISGGTGSGKTTFLNALSEFIPEEERVITIEDAAELQLTTIKNLVRLESRIHSLEGKNQVTIRDLVKNALRQRPDRIIVGEVRGEEAFEMLQAMNTGHEGSLSTGHGNNTREMISRLENMVMMGIDLPLIAVKKQISSALDLVIHLGRTPKNKRKVLEIVQIAGMEDGEIVYNRLFEYIEEEEPSPGQNPNQEQNPDQEKRQFHDSSKKQSKERLVSVGVMLETKRIFKGKN